MRKTQKKGTIFHEFGEGRGPNLCVAVWLGVARSYFRPPLAMFGSITAYPRSNDDDRPRNAVPPRASQHGAPAADPQGGRISHVPAFALCRRVFPVGSRAYGIHLPEGALQKR